MKNFVQPGNNVTVTAAATTTSGQLVVQPSLVGVALTDAASGAEVEIATTGVFKYAMASGATLNVGALAYLNSSDELTNTAGSDPAVGVVVGTYSTDHRDLKVYGHKLN